MSPLSLSPNLYRDVAHAMRTKDKAANILLNRGSSRRELARSDIYAINYIDDKTNININNYIYMKDILNKALAANADTDAVAKVIDTVVNTPRQDAQSDTAIGRSLAVEEALAKRYKALRKAVIDVITEAIFGSMSVDDATDAVIGLVTAGRIIDIDTAKGKDKSDRVVLTRDANGRIIELRGVNNDNPDELY